MRKPMTIEEKKQRVDEILKSITNKIKEAKSKNKSTTLEEMVDNDVFNKEELEILYMAISYGIKV